MPKNFYPDNMVKRKKNRSNGGTFLSFVVILVGLGLCVMLAMLFSNFITVGSFSFSNNNEMKKNGYTIYAVSIFLSTNFSSAGASAASFQDKGAAGYIYFDNGIFHVLARLQGKIRCGQSCRKTYLTRSKRASSDNQGFFNLTFWFIFSKRANRAQQRTHVLFKLL